MNRRYFTSAAFILLVGTAFPIDRQTALRKAESLLRKIDPEISSVELERLDGTCVSRGFRLGEQQLQWRVTSGRRLLSVDDETGEVTLYSDSKLYSRAMMGPESAKDATVGRPMFLSEEACISFARAKLDAIGWSSGISAKLKAELPRVNGEGSVPRTIVYVQFEDRPNGFPAGGVGNSISVGLDSLSGEVVELERGFGRKYGPAIVGITRDQAVAIAKRSVEVVESPEVLGPMYTEFSGRNEELFGRGEQYCRSRTLPLVYLIHGVSYGVFVAADNGELLCRFRNAIASSPLPIRGVSKAEAQRGADTLRGALKEGSADSGSNTLSIMGVSIAAAIAFGFWWLLRRRQR